MNVCLLVLDCLRLDYWHAMPKAQAATNGEGWHHLDNHWAVAHCSDPNHAALFTGFGPWSTGVTTQMGLQYQDKLPTLFWRWKRETKGYTCALQPVKAPAFYRDYVDDIAWHKGTDSADLELRAVKAFQETAGNEWSFMFIRDMTCHYPYLDLDMPARGEAAEIRPQYEEAVAHVDIFVERLIETLCPKNTLIIICADHGEMLGEHGAYDHLYGMWSILTHVPMAMYLPYWPHKRTDAPTSHIDLVPTLSDMFGWEAQGEGQSWAKWLYDEADDPSDRNRKLWLQGTGAGPVSDEHLQARGGLAIDPGLGRILWRHRGLVWHDWKYVEDIHADGYAEAHLTVPSDYLEEKNYHKKRNRVVKRMRAHVPPVPDYHDWEQRVIGNRRARHDAAILARLKALGYA